MTKHIEVDCHFLNKNILSSIIKTASICSKDQFANIFIKSLWGSRITYICASWMHNIYVLQHQVGYRYGEDIWYN